MPGVVIPGCRENFDIAIYGFCQVIGGGLLVGFYAERGKPRNPRRHLAESLINHIWLPTGRVAISAIAVRAVGIPVGSRA